jgi:hypothetical protein
MRLALRLPAVCLPCAAVLAFAFPLFSQDSATAPGLQEPAVLPEAPRPRVELADVELSEQAPAPQTPGTPTQAGPQSTQSPPAGGTSSSQSATPNPDAGKSAQQTAEEQLKAQEHQRVFGVMATFNTTSNNNALPLSSKQKFQLFFKSATDPWPFLLASVVSGIGQADNSYPEWGQGLQGYAKRFGAAYSDAFIGNFFGNAVLTSLLKEDPRYFQKGKGSMTKRFLWAASSTVWCKRDNGKWGPNYANVGGNLIGSAVARVYYPASERTVGNTVSDGLTVSAEGIVGAEVIEFWPDMVRHHQRKKAEKLARQQAAQDAAAKASGQPATSNQDQKPK